MPEQGMEQKATFSELTIEDSAKSPELSIGDSVTIPEQNGENSVEIPEQNRGKEQEAGKDYTAQRETTECSIVPSEDSELPEFPSEDGSPERVTMRSKTRVAADQATKLQESIKLGDLKAVKELLNSLQDVKSLENTFVETDPVNLAINCREEAIALYLVEKGFSVDKRYQSPSNRCDQWCYSKHGENKCPAEYDAADNAASKKMHKLKELIDSIRSGRRRPGEGLVDLTVPERPIQKPQPPSQAKPQFQRLQVPRTQKETPKSAAFEAVNLLKRYGNKYVTKDGCTLLHRSATSTPAHIYVMASNGVPVNIQNLAGDTALHLAVKADNYETAEALLMCCADLTVRNKMGQTPLDLAEGQMRDMLCKAEPDPIRCILQKMSASLYKHFRKNWCNMECVVKNGAVATLLSGRGPTLARLLPMFWCSTDTIVKDGMTLVQLAMVKSDEGDANIADCCRILQDFRDSSELIHCVLSENTARLHEILVRRRGKSVNVRLRDRFGKTLLSHAIESNNLEIVQMLVNAGARVNGIRVRENSRSDHTVPLFHKTLRKDLQPEIAHFIYSVQDASEMMEKDHNGNTALLRAVEEGVSDRVIDWLLVAENGMNIVQRNQNEMNARELAVSKGRSDIVQTIDRYVLQQRGKFFLPKLPVHFYGLDNLQFTDEQVGKTLLEVVEEGKDSDDIKSLRHHLEIEARGVRLFDAAANGDLSTVSKMNVANFQDKNGYTALIRAIVFNRLDVVKYLCTSRPVLKSMPDNCNRYPLHYACAMPEAQGKEFIKVLLESKPEDIEKKVDKDGKFPAEYIQMRNSKYALQMLYDARTLTANGREGPPLGPLPECASDFPPGY